ncbi:uncharacterized protein B0T23DRAFT_403928 [Neurospora hispaniola]|uniref:SCA7 domain-containing protein n=1 Tax=Neurospora hispaniola TaxID=588809 RepID=A0AAJ0IAS5_9PEZI|nr:hypothetical protein B0T23DRAFT_403928 [Neurospora hispaniola]
MFGYYYAVYVHCLNKRAFIPNQTAFRVRWHRSSYQHNDLFIAGHGALRRTSTLPKSRYWHCPSLIHALQQPYNNPFQFPTTTPRCVSWPPTTQLVATTNRPAVSPSTTPSFSLHALNRLLGKQSPRWLPQPTNKLSKPGNWKEATTPLDNEEKKRAKENAALPSPIINQLDPPAQVTFDTGRPLDDVPDLIYCKLCKKGVIRTSGKEHIDECLRIKREKAQRKKEAREARERAKEAAREEEARKNDPDGAAGRDDDDSDADEPTERKGNGGKTTKKATGKKPDTGGKKRKAEGDLEKGKAKKKKDEPKPKTAKPKGPVDVERQCGVILPNGQPCARSLTCKSHSMSAKRSVPGRSLPYDMLLVAYQKKNQAKQQRAAIDANAPLEDDDDPNAGAVDSDEETAAVMNALANWRPQPVVPQPIIAPIKRQYQLARLHEQLQTVTNGGRLNIFKVVGFGAQKLPEGHPGLYQQEEEHAGDPDVSMQEVFSRRSSTFSLAGPPQRRPSLVRQILPPHVSDFMKSPRDPRRPADTKEQYLRQTFAPVRRDDSVRSPHPESSSRPGTGASSHKPPRQAYPAQKPPSRDAERTVARPGPTKHYYNESPARKDSVGVALRGGGSEVGSPRTHNLVSPAAAQTPARHPSRRLSSASPGQNSLHLSPHVPDEVRAMDAKICPEISPEEMDMLREIYIACQQHPEKFDEYRQEYQAYQQRLQAQKGLSGGKQPTGPQSASPATEVPPRSTFDKTEHHETQRALEQAQFKPTCSPRHGSSTVFRGGTASPSNTLAGTRQRPEVSSPVTSTQQSLPDTPHTPRNHQRKRSGPIPRIILKVPKRTLQPNMGVSPMKGGSQRDVVSSPRKTHGPVGGKSLKDSSVEESSLVGTDD